MHNQRNPRFNFLVGWCCLLSVAVMVMAIVLVVGPRKGMTNKTEETPIHEYSKGSQDPMNHIQLVSRHNSGSHGNISWMHSQTCFCENTSLLLQNNAVKVTRRGFYFTYTQVTLTPKDGSKGEQVKITLVANKEMKGQKTRKLLEAQHQSSGTLSMSGVVHLMKGDIVHVNLESTKLIVLKDETETYWGLYLLDRLDEDY
ncbi:lymphotoxin-alpha [Hoplias malabaricus]|uniref:lymphotoxin-alpha n=1 Tax=Hoplias malabaricus TaxID=27720 RepID=UPI003462DC61